MANPGTHRVRMVAYGVLAISGVASICVGLSGFPGHLDVEWRALLLSFGWVASVAGAIGLVLAIREDAVHGAVKGGER